MGFCLTEDGFNQVFKAWAGECRVFAPTRVAGGGLFSDNDRIRYAPVDTVQEIVFDEKASYSFKEALTPPSQTLFHFTDDADPEAAVRETFAPATPTIVFLRACDLHAVRRLDAIYLQNGPEDVYYRRMRDKMRFVLLPCEQSFEHCFCVDMGTNRAENYDASIIRRDGKYIVDCRCDAWSALFASFSEGEADGTPPYVKENKVHASIPEGLSLDVMRSTQWDEYDSRCIACGRCNFVCPTCTCFSMQDFFYTDNGRLGERRRVWASCMVDGFTNVAGGGEYRSRNGQRMRFKALHKVYDFNKRFGFQMCVGCGRCDAVCPEYISFSHCINKLESMVGEVSGNAE